MIKVAVLTLITTWLIRA